MVTFNCRSNKCNTRSPRRRILQWSLLSNGKDFKQFINDQTEKPEIICIQETLLKPFLDFIAVRHDRKEGNGTGCLTLIKEGIPYKIIDREGDLEYVGSEVWIGGKVIMVINFYNPCIKLELSKLEEIDMKGNIIWCGVLQHIIHYGGVRKL